MAVHSGHHQFGANRDCLALTTREGLVAQTGHDLNIEVGKWSAELEATDERTATGLTAEVDMSGTRP